jgi:dihydrofolate reductase
MNSTLLKTDVADEVQRLKEPEDQNLLVYGSGALVDTLMQDNFIQVYRLMLYPAAPASGKRLFREGPKETALKLADIKTTANGVVVLRYEPAAGDAGG